jgi:hypothetical protein
MQKEQRVEIIWYVKSIGHFNSRYFQINIMHVLFRMDNTWEGIIATVINGVESILSCS